VNVIFTTFHIMVAIGFILIGVGLGGIFLLMTGRVFTARWFLWFLPFLIPLPYIANEVGWIGAEIGRQPWIVYGLLRTADAATTVVSVTTIAWSLGCLITVYVIISAFLVYFLRRVIGKEIVAF
jgi:cytochrome d ubiquinol oxidase subunit I